MPKPRTEEQFPLLLVLVGDQDVSQNNKRLFGRGRFDGITSGATAIMTEWPNYLSSCWITALICGLTLFAVSMMLTSCMTTYQPHPRLPRCSSDSNLVLNTTIHLVHTSHKWSPNQLELVENISSAYPHYQIHILIIGNKIPKTNIIKKEVNATHLNETHAVNTTETILEDLVRQSPNVFVTHNTYRNFFESSPLFLNWVALNNPMKIFAVRVIQLWQFGGLSYDLLEYKMHKGRRHRNCSKVDEKKVWSYVQDGCNRYEHLDSEEVSVDPQGLHMECKTPCHAFFEKVLSKLRRSSFKSTPRELLTGPIYTFCKAGVIDREFCHIKSILFE